MPQLLEILMVMMKMVIQSIIDDDFDIDGCISHLINDNLNC
jgi:hypothetical protein